MNLNSKNNIIAFQIVDAKSLKIQLYRCKHLTRLCSAFINNLSFEYSIPFMYSYVS